MNRLTFFVVFALLFAGCNGEQKSAEDLTPVKKEPAAPNLSTEKSTETSPSKTKRGSGRVDRRLQMAGKWRISAIGSDIIPEGSSMIIAFTPKGVSVFGGCNTLKAQPGFGLHSFHFRVEEQTQKVCEKSVMDREESLFDAISKVELLKVWNGDEAGFTDKEFNILFSAQREP